jgi:hypothetical protein
VLEQLRCCQIALLMPVEDGLGDIENPGFSRGCAGMAGITRSDKKVFGFEPPRAGGHRVVDAVQAMVDGRAKVFIGLGGNFVRAVPDWPAAERRCGG